MSAAENHQSEIFLPGTDHSIRLPVFEGPLDLLLYLIRRNEVDIYDIPIETVTRQYLDILASMGRMDLELAGEFFVMAATLMYIKSRMLLPAKEQMADEENNEEQLDPRWELVQQLVEYKKFKEAAADLEQLILHSNDLIPRRVTGERAEKTERSLKPSDRLDIWQTFNLVLRRLSERIHEGEINAEQVTVSDRMEFVLKKLETCRSFRFSSIFESMATVTTVVATFLAILELTRLQKITLQQDASFADIEISAVAA